MLTYLLGDVLRIFTGDATKMFAEEGEFTQGMWLGIAVMMVIPIIMVVVARARVVARRVRVHSVYFLYL